VPAIYTESDDKAETLGIELKDTLLDLSDSIVFCIRPVEWSARSNGSGWMILGGFFIEKWYIILRLIAQSVRCSICVIGITRKSGYTFRLILFIFEDGVGMDKNCLREKDARDRLWKRSILAISGGTQSI
jgi:hypothetical protein